MEDIFKKDLSGAMVSPDDPGYDKLIGAIFDSMKLAYALNDGYHTPEEVRGFLSRITGQEIDETVTLLPPFYVDTTGRTSASANAAGFNKAAHSATAGASQSETMCSSRQK